METLPENDVCKQAFVSSTIESSPFALLLNFRERRISKSSRAKLKAVQGNCDSNQWQEPDGKCAALRCSPGKLLFEDRTCRTALEGMRGLGYNLSLWLVPTGRDNSTVSESLMGLHALDVMISLRESLTGLMLNFAAYFSLKLGVILPRDNGTISSTPFLAWVAGRFIARKSWERDIIECLIVEKLLVNDLEVKVRGQIEFGYQTVVMVNKVDEHNFCREMKATSSNICYTDSLDSGLTFQHKLTLQFEDSFLKVSNILNCSFVSFEKWQYNLSINHSHLPPRVILTLDLNITTIVISNYSYLNFISVEGNGVLNICYEILDELLHQQYEFVINQSLDNDTGIPESSEAEYIVSLTCIGASMVCLLLTLVTYFLFPALRTTAGKNTMFLSLSLLLADGSLLASLHMRGPSWACTAVGITTHFCWLWMFTWTFISSLHMFRVFTAKTRSFDHTAQSPQDRQLVKYLALSLSLPVVVIATVIVTLHVSTGGSRIGYGDTACYLEPALIVLAVIAPLALTTISNITFFIITVVKIHRVDQPQPTSSLDEHRNLYVYVKLSSLTGGFWGLAVIAEVFDIDELRFVSIVLNGLQGVFIFLSFVCSKRVLNFYLVSFGLEPLSTTLASESRTRSFKSRKNTF